MGWRCFRVSGELGVLAGGAGEHKKILLDRKNHNKDTLEDALLELKAYDYMLRFEKNFNGFETVSTAYDFIILCYKSCKVEFMQTKDEIGQCRMALRD